jgi:exopolyphosphatase / guanosine-5'-triphosphate,3'-diphosphate pyrophosphatase
VRRVAAIDIGTNSTRLLVADVDGEELTPVIRRSVVTRLGEGVDAGHHLLPEPIGRTLATVGAFREEITRLGAERTLVVATSATRDAENGAEFLAEVARRFGFPTRLLTGDEEAELTRRGVGAADESTLVLDVGGGSTELILGPWRTSLDIGSVRLTERFLRSDPPRPAELAAAAGYVDDLLPKLGASAAIGVAGTVTQLHQLAGELTAEAVEYELARLARLTVAERAEVPGMDPGRAPVIVGGAIVVREVMRRYHLHVLAWSERDLLDGAALLAASARS